MRLILGLLISGFSLPLYAQACEDLEVHGVWLDPFDNQKVNLLCANLSFEEIYSYPAWLIKDGEGNLIAEEQVMYFGIAGTSYHVLEMIEPWQGGAVPIDVTLELWTGFGDQMACTWDWVFHPQELLWTGNGDGGCFPIAMNSYAVGGEGSSVTASLSDSAGNLVLSQLMVFDESGFYQGASDTFCLGQDECYTLTLNSTAFESLSIEFTDPTEFSSWNMNHWTFWVNHSEPMALDTAFQIDLYGGDCVLPASTADIKSDFLVFPNPTDGMVQIDLGSSTSQGHFQVFDHAGRCVQEDMIIAGQRVLDLTGLESGQYLLILFQDRQHLVQQLIVAGGH